MNFTRKQAFGIFCLCSTVFTTFADDEPCDKTKCPGPISYYEDLLCKPEYKNEGDCCAYKYNCDHLDERSSDKCYINGHEYDIGEKLREEDAAPCDIGCHCIKRSEVAQFNCAIVDCFRSPSKPGCYFKNSVLSCCPGEQVCPEKPEDRATCEVDGKIYKDGEHFIPNSDPDKICVCQPGYKGENVKPFCRTAVGCRVSFHHAYEIKNNCVPTFYQSQSPQTDCSYAYRCQNKHDKVIEKSKRSETNHSDVCKFGNLTMNYGDELNQATNYSSVCVKCVCEVPPLPTCQRLPDDECDVTKHPDFGSLEYEK